MSDSKQQFTVEEALGRILEAVRPLTATERVFLRDALDRVLAQDVPAAFDIPPSTNSAMDGYAVNAADLPETGTRRLRVVGEVLAGHPTDRSIAPGECMRIMTGGLIPDGADTVLMQEQVERDGDEILIGHGQRAGQHVRHAGEDLRSGDIVLQAGRRLQPPDLGLLASQGVVEVGVIRRPIVAFFSTGDELKGLGQPLASGEIYDSNRYTLFGMLRRLGVEIFDFGVVGDDREALDEAIRRATAIADVVVTSGGVSVGAVDYVKQSLEALGRINFWRIAMKPGRPLTFGHLGDTMFFGLPGNPVSVMATFALFVRPAILRLSGEANKPALKHRAVTEHALKKHPGRTDFQRGVFRQDDNGVIRVSTTGLQGSHVLSSMSRANCLVVLPLDWGDVPEGTEVEILPFDALF
ncbi:MAG: molybdopterin molybdotransferase MoeA [Chromatiales bacterium]|jgi:molybdopterin molybdotransferase